MAGYSSNPLSKKLGLKGGQCIKLIHAPTNYPALIGEVFDGLTQSNNATSELDFIHLFTNSLAELEDLLPKLMMQIKKSGTIWVSWYKGSAKKPTELTENIIRETALGTGLVDVKVCAINELWSGLKLVFRLSDR